MQTSGLLRTADNGARHFQYRPLARRENIARLTSTRARQSLPRWNTCWGRGHSLFCRVIEYRLSGVWVLEVRIIFGKSSTPVSNQARCVQVAA
jgi:hypothetical protein